MLFTYIFSAQDGKKSHGSETIMCYLLTSFLHRMAVRVKEVKPSCIIYLHPFWVAWLKESRELILVCSLCPTWLPFVTTNQTFPVKKLFNVIDKE